MKFRGEIEGLRAIAVSLVIIYHFKFSIISGGFIGVDVFFVISGFLIMSLILNEYKGNLRENKYRKIFSLSNFYIRRAKRIVPLSLVVIVVTTVFSALLLNAERRQLVMIDAIWATFFVANIHFINNATDYFASDSVVSPLQHFWTLSVEEQFYLFFPSFLYIQLSGRARYIFGKRIRWQARVYLLVIPVTLLSLFHSISQTREVSLASYFSTSTRAWEIGLGVLLATYQSGHSRQLKTEIAKVMAFLGLGGILVSAIIFDEQTPMPGIAALLPTISTCALILATSHEPNITSKFLNFKVLRFLGRISYSLYLWHWPILILFSIKFAEFFGSILYKFLLLLLLLIVSTITYYLVEKPFRNANLPRVLTKRHSILRLRQIIAWITFVSFMMFAISISFFPKNITEYQPKSGAINSQSDSNTDIFDRNLPANKLPGTAKSPFLDVWKDSLEAASLMRKVPNEVSPPITNLEKTSEYWKNCFAKTNAVSCTYGNSGADSTKTAIVFGDSYSISILPTVLGSLDLTQWKVDVLAHAECMIANVTPVRNGKEVPGCRSYREWAFTYVASLQPAIIFTADNPDVPIFDDQGKIVITPGSNLNSYWVSQMKSSIIKLQKSTQLLVTFGPPPQPLQSLTQCISQNLEISLDCFAKQQSRSKPRLLGKNLTLANGGIFIDLSEVFCIKGICPPIIENTIVYYDGNHISYEMAIKLIPFLKEKIFRII
jgi:peptidoglycan/LPS O-acetylase OafA/YrhL